MQYELQPWSETWGAVVRFVRDGVERMKRESPLGHYLELVENPPRTIVIQLHGKPGGSVQAGVSLAGDRIEITTPENTTLGRLVDPQPDVLRIKLRDHRAVFTDDNEDTVDPDEVAGIILAAVLRYYRHAA